MKTRIAVALLLALALPVLSGCSTIGGLVSDATGGSVNVGNTVPEDFPGQVQLTDGDVVAAASVIEPTTNAKVWNITVSADATLAEVSTELTEAGFASSSEVVANFPAANGIVGDSIGGFTDGHWAVLAGTQDLPTGGAVVNYAVTQLPG
jgi:predicted small secreted protein